MYMLQKRVIVDVELLMNTSMHVGIMEQGVCTLHVRAWERRRRRVGAAWRRRAKKNSAATPPLSRQKDGMTLVPTLLALRAGAAPATRQRPACVARRRGGGIVHVHRHVRARGRHRRAGSQRRKFRKRLGA